MTIVVEKTAGVVLAGGRSSRMGSPKAALEWHGSTLLRRTVSVVAPRRHRPRRRGAGARPAAARPAARGRGRVATRAEGRGPLQGIAVGSGRPGRPGRRRLRLLHRPAVPAPGVRRRRARCADAGGRRGAAGRPRLPAAAGRRLPHRAWRRWWPPSSPPTACARPSSSTQCRVVRLDDAALRADPFVAALDPELDSVVNVNEAAEYEQARGRPAPEVTVAVLRRRRHPCGRGPAHGPGGHAGPGRGRGRAAPRPARGRGAQRRADHQGRPAAAHHRRHGGVPLGGRRGAEAGARRLLRSSPRGRTLDDAQLRRCSSCPSRCCAPTSAAPVSARG